MEKNGNSCPIVACEKIFKAASDYSGFRAIRRTLTSSCKQEPKPSKPLPPLPPSPSVKSINIQKLPKAVEPSHQQNTPVNEEAAEVIPINYTPSTTLPEKSKTANSFSVNQKKTSQVTKVASKFEPEPSQPTQRNAWQGLEQDVKSKFKVESLQAEDEECKKTGVDIEDRFSDYINRARKRIGRTISNMGDGLKMGRSRSNIGDGKKPSGRDRFTEYIDRTKMRIRSTPSIGAGKYSSSK